MSQNVLIELNGTKRYLCNEPDEYLKVVNGTVYVYVISAHGGRIGRNLFLCECHENDDIPSLSAVHGSTAYRFALMAKDHATLRIFKGDDNYESIRRNFLNNVGVPIEADDNFANAVISWYQNKLTDERKRIDNVTVEQKKIHESKLNLMASLFNTSDLITFDNDSESPLYNAVHSYCQYLNIEICSYQTLLNTYGENFTIYNIADLSHFVVRKVTLNGDWYKRSEESIIATRKENQEPLILIRNGRNYIVHDMDDKTSEKLTADLAEELEHEAYIAYDHLPDHKLKLSEVMLFSFRHVNISDIVRFVLMYLFTTLLGLLLPYLNEMFYDKLIPLGDVSSILQVGIVMFGTMVANIFFSLVQNLASFRGVKKMEYALVSASYDRIFRLPQSFIDSFGTMELVNRVNAISTVFSSTVSAGVSAFMGLILSGFYVWHMFDKSKSLAWRGLIVTLLSGLVMFYFGTRRIPSQTEKQKLSTKANATLYQLISGVMKIKVSGIENRGLYEFQKDNIAALKQDMRSNTIANIGNAVSTIMHVFYLGVIYYTVVKKRSVLSLGQYSSFAMAYAFFTGAVQQVIGFFLTMADLFPVIERVRPIFETEAENDHDSTSPGRISGSIEVSHLSFTYPGDYNEVLHDISMKIEPGELIAIVGPSGCGKSTLLKCMLGFEKATRGKIYYDDKDIDTLDKRELRRQLGAVLQDGQLVMGTIMTNVTLSAPYLTVDEVEDILKDADIYDDIAELPMGVYTNVSEGSGSLSGGQRQRILIARALANNPKIVLFDEATSALDNIAQQKVCENLEKRHVTRIMIAHRLSTVKNCDRIYVMDKGEIVEIGNYEQLIAKKGLFYELAKRQMVNEV